MGMQLFIIIVASMHANWSKTAVISKGGAKSMLKVIKKVIKYKNIKCHNFDFKFSGENPMVYDIQLQRYSPKAIPYK